MASPWLEPTTSGEHSSQELLLQLMLLLFRTSKVCFLFYTHFTLQESGFNWIIGYLFLKPKKSPRMQPFFSFVVIYLSHYFFPSFFLSCLFFFKLMSIFFMAPMLSRASFTRPLRGVWISIWITENAQKHGFFFTL
jgi:hypothetical protein